MVVSRTTRNWNLVVRPGFLVVCTWNKVLVSILYLNLSVYSDHTYKGEFWLQIDNSPSDNCISIFGCPGTFFVVSGAQTTKILNAGHKYVGQDASGIT